ERGFLLGEGEPRFRRRVPEPAHLGGSGIEPTETVEKRPMARWIEKSALVMLPVNFDKRIAHLPEKADAHRLIVDEGPRAPVLGLHAAKNEFAFRIEPVIAENGAGRMVVRHVENGG